MMACLPNSIHLADKICLPLYVSVGDCDDLYRRRCDDSIAVWAGHRRREDIGASIPVPSEVGCTIALPEGNREAGIRRPEARFGVGRYRSPSEFDVHELLVKAYAFSEPLLLLRGKTAAFSGADLMLPKASLAITVNCAGAPTTAADSPVSPLSTCSSAVQLGV